LYSFNTVFSIGTTLSTFLFLFNISADEFQTKISKELTINADKDITIKGSGVALN
jgi:hypothetical protein